MPESQARCECLWKKMVGKPYSGKPNVRIDEGELEIEPTSHYASSLLYRKAVPEIRFTQTSISSRTLQKKRLLRSLK